MLHCTGNCSALPGVVQTGGSAIARDQLPRCCEHQRKRTALTRVAHAGGDAVDGDEQSVAQRGAAGLQPQAAQHLGLDDVDGVNVGIAHVDEVAQRKVVVQQRRVACGRRRAAEYIAGYESGCRIGQCNAC